MNAATVCILAGAVSEQSPGYEAGNEAWELRSGDILSAAIIVTGGGSIVN